MERAVGEPRASGDREGQVTRDTASPSKTNPGVTAEFLRIRSLTSLARVYTSCNLEVDVCSGNTELAEVWLLLLLLLIRL